MFNALNFFCCCLIFLNVGRMNIIMFKYTFYFILLCALDEALNPPSASHKKKWYYTSGKSIFNNIISS